MKQRTYLAALWLAAMAALTFSCSQQQQNSGFTATASASGEPDRTVLPIREPIYPAITEVDARKAKAPARFEVTPPPGAPNVLVILIDDQGFGVSSAFGGPVHEPVLESLASEGLRY